MKKKDDNLIVLDTSLLNLNMDKEEVEVTKDSTVLGVILSSKNLRVRTIAIVVIVVIIIII